MGKMALWETLEQSPKVLQVFFKFWIWVVVVLGGVVVVEAESFE